MSEKWRKHKSATEYDDLGYVPSVQGFDDYGPVEPMEAELLTVGGMVVGGTFGFDKPVELLPKAYFKRYASAMPEAPEHYDISSQRVEKSKAEADADYLGTRNPASLLKHPDR